MIPNTDVLYLSTSFVIIFGTQFGCPAIWNIRFVKKKKAQETTEWPQVQPVYFMSPLNIHVLGLV